MILLVLLISIAYSSIFDILKGGGSSSCSVEGLDKKTTCGISCKDYQKAVCARTEGIAHCWCQETENSIAISERKSAKGFCSGCVRKLSTCVSGLKTCGDEVKRLREQCARRSGDGVKVAEEPAENAPNVEKSAPKADVQPLKEGVK